MYRGLKLLAHIQQIQIQPQIRVFQQVHVSVLVSANFKHLFDLFYQYNRPRQDSNLQSSDPKSDALSIRPRGRHGTFAIPRK